jgi:transcriptional regulator with XRE-family HTH domain
MLLTNELKRIRKEKHLTQKWVGERLNMAQGQLSHIESGKGDPRLSSILEIARVLDHKLVLIPRSHLPMVNSLIKDKSDTSIDSPAWLPDDEDN